MKHATLSAGAVAITMGVGSLVLQRWVAETRPAALTLVIAWFALVGIAVVVFARRRPEIRVAVLGTFALVVAATVAVGYWTGFRDTEVNEDIVVAEAEASETDRAAGLAGGETEAKPAEGEKRKPDREADRPQPGPVNLASGSFSGVDGHSGTGTATVVSAPEGDRTLTFTDFDVDPGPTVEVWLTKDESSLDDRIELGTLKGNVGDQQYEVPQNADLGTYDTVVLYCIPFTVRIAVAALK